MAGGDDSFAFWGLIGAGAAILIGGIVLITIGAVNLSKPLEDQGEYHGGYITFAVLGPIIAIIGGGLVFFIYTEKDTTKENSPKTTSNNTSQAGGRRRRRRSI